MTRKKCKVLGCREEYEYTCKFSFYGITTMSQAPPARDEWIEGALRGDARSLWHEVSVVLCRTHYADSRTALWLESPALRHLMAVDFTPSVTAGKSGEGVSEHGNAVSAEHAYSRAYSVSPAEIANSATARTQSLVKGKLNVRDLLDNVSYMSRKAPADSRLWVVGVRGDGAPGCVSETHEVVRRVEGGGPQSVDAEEVVIDDGVVASDVYDVDQLEPFEEVVIKMESRDDDETTVLDDLVYEYPDPGRSETVDWVARPLPENKYNFIAHEKVSRYKEKCIRRTQRRQTKLAGNGISTTKYYTQEYPYHDPTKTIEVSIEEVHLPPPKANRSEIICNNARYKHLILDNSKNKKYIFNIAGNEDEMAANSILPTAEDDSNQAVAPQQQVYILKRPIQKKNVVKVKPKRPKEFVQDVVLKDYVQDFGSHEVQIETDIYVPDVVASEQYVTCVPYIEMKNVPGSFQVGDTISVMDNSGDLKEEIVMDESQLHQVSGSSGYQLSSSHVGKNVLNLLECHSSGECEKEGSDEREAGAEGQVRFSSTRVRKKKRKLCACDCEEA